jgi:hypothetical protein
VFSRTDIMLKLDVGSIGGTYGGNAIACAAAAATIRAIREESMLENAMERGIQLMTGLRKLQEEYSQIGDVRGKGLMIGTEFVVDGRPEKAKPLVKEVIHCAEIMDSFTLCGIKDNTIRWISVECHSEQIPTGSRFLKVRRKWPGVKQTGNKYTGKHALPVSLSTEYWFICDPATHRSKLADLLKAEEQLFHTTHPKSYELYQRARKSLHGGVPMLWMIRWAGSFPVFVKEAKGAHFRDVDGNSYIDFCLGDTGAMTGHSPDATVNAIKEQIQKGITLMLPYEDVIWVGEDLQRRFGLPYWQFALTATEIGSLRMARMIRSPNSVSTIVITAPWMKPSLSSMRKARPCRAPTIWARKSIRS